MGTTATANAHMLHTGFVTDPCPCNALHLFRVRVSVAMLALLPMWLGAPSPADDAVANPGGDVQAAQIDEWVEQLASGEFAVRALATDSLIDTGLPAVEPRERDHFAGSADSGFRMSAASPESTCFDPGP